MNYFHYSSALLKSATHTVSFRCDEASFSFVREGSEIYDGFSIIT